MAERRMFAKTIIDSDDFLDMPLSTQCLYFHLSMRADDDGFINNPKKIMRMIGAAQNEIELLLSKQFLIYFDSGVVVIKHWKIHNYIQKDRYKQTLYTEELNQLTTGENRIYESKKEHVYITDTECVQDGYAGKVSLELEEGKSKSKSILILSGSVKEIMQFFNQTCDTAYRDTSEKTKALINARIKEKFTVTDFKTVISKKYKEWHNTDMAKYLRPMTLFGSKFESYLNQKETDKKGSMMAVAKKVYDLSVEARNES